MNGPRYVPTPENADDTEAARAIEQGILEEVEDEPETGLTAENEEWIPF